MKLMTTWVASAAILAAAAIVPMTATASVLDKAKPVHVASTAAIDSTCKVGALGYRATLPIALKNDTGDYTIFIAGKTFKSKTSPTIIQVNEPAISKKAMNGNTSNDQFAAKGLEDAKNWAKNVGTGAAGLVAFSAAGAYAANNAKARFLASTAPYSIDKLALDAGGLLINTKMAFDDGIAAAVQAKMAPASATVGAIAS